MIAGSDGMANNFSSKVILITGTSSGFGLLTAARLAAAGHHVIATMRDINKKEALLSEVRKRGGNVDVLALDVTKPETIKQATQFITEKHGYLDVLVNNAGYGIGGCFEDLTDTEFRAQMETNFFGVLNVTRACIPLMRWRPSAKIINISSTSGCFGTPGLSAYVSSKFALEGFSESLHHELKNFGIHVVLVEPGTYRTKIFEENGRYTKNFENKDSPYYNLSQFLKQKVINYIKDNHKDLEEVPELIERIIYSSNPKFRNIPDIESQALLSIKRLIPFRLLSWIVSRSLKQKYPKKHSA